MSNLTHIIKLFLFFILIILSTISCSSTKGNLSSDKLTKIGLGKPKSSSVIVNEIKYRIATINENTFSEENNEIELLFEISNTSNEEVIIEQPSLENDNNPFLILFLRNKTGKLVKKYKLNYNNLSINSSFENNNKKLSRTKVLIIKGNESKEYLLKIKIPQKATEKYSLFSLKTKLNFLSKVEKRNLLSIFLKKELNFTE